jgi:hypothetical protein
MLGITCLVVKGTPMGPVLWIDQNTFSSDFIEKIFKKKNIPFHSLKEARGFSYLVDDLRPSVIVLDSQTVMASLEDFKTEYVKSQFISSTPFIFINNIPALEFIQSIGLLSKPLDPFKVPDAILSMLTGASSHH